MNGRYPLERPGFHRTDPQWVPGACDEGVQRIHKGPAWHGANGVAEDGVPLQILARRVWRVRKMRKHTRKMKTKRATVRVEKKAIPKNNETPLNTKHCKKMNKTALKKPKNNIPFIEKQQSHHYEILLSGIESRWFMCIPSDWWIQTWFILRSAPRRQDWNKFKNATLFVSLAFFLSRVNWSHERWKVPS